MIGIVSINHKTAPINIREQLIFKPEEIHQFSNILLKKCNLNEIVLFSTCNRTEIYFYMHDQCAPKTFNSILKELSDFKNIKKELHDYFRFFKNTNAVKHLFLVASGLDSMVLGENQVLGQVKEAYSISTSGNFTNTVFNKLFHKSFEAGKKVRTETRINEGASSISYAAVELAAKIFGDIQKTPVLLVGAGETGELVVQSLKDRGCEKIYITNRTFTKAQEMADKYDAVPVDFLQRDNYLDKVDILITSTASQKLLYEYDKIKQILTHRNNRPIFLIDLSVPRNIDEKIKKLKNSFLYDVDDLEEVVAHNFEKRKEEIQKAELIVDHILQEFMLWLDNQNLKPTIDKLKTYYDRTLHRELKKIKNKIPENDYDLLKEFGTKIKNKYIGKIVKNLKLLTNNGETLSYIELVNDLYELNQLDVENEN